MKPPRTRSETIAGSAMLALAGLFVGLFLAFWMSAADHRWALLTWMGFHVLLFTLWGSAVLHGGWSGRRYEEPA